MSQTVWPLNENGEIVFTAGTGSSNVTGYLNQDVLPSADGGIPVRVKDNSFVSPQDFENFSEALLYASNNNKVLRLVDGGNYTLNEDVVLTNGLMMRGSAYIKIGENVKGVVVSPSTSAPVSVTSITSTQFPSATGIEVCSAILVQNAASFSKNDVCMIRSADTYTVLPTVRKAELFKINEVIGNTIYVSGILKDSYTSATVLKLSQAVVDIDGPIFTYDGDYLTPTSKTREAALTLIGCCYPRVKARFSKDVSDGLRMYACYRPNVDVLVDNLRNDDTNLMYGYGVSAYGCCTQGTIKVIADNVRHAYTDGTFVSVSQPMKDGVCRGMVVYDSISRNSTFASFDTHPGGCDTSFINCGVIFNITNPEQPTRNNAYAFQDRGLNTTYTNCWSQYCRIPFYFASVEYDYGVKNSTRVFGGFHEGLIKGQSTSSAPTKTSMSGAEIIFDGVYFYGLVPSQGNQSGSVIRWENCKFNGDNTFGISAANNTGDLVFYGCTFTDFSTMRFGQGNNLQMISCKRFNSGTFIEPIIVGTGTTNTIHDLLVIAPSYGNSSLIRAGAGTDSGNVVIHLGTVFAKNFTYSSVISTNGVATLSILNMDVKQKPVKKGTTANRPTLSTYDIGFYYLDTTLDSDGKPIWWNGNLWVDATGASV